MIRLAQKFDEEVVPALTKQFGYSTRMAVPKVAKVVVNMGVGEAVADPKLLDQAVEELGMIVAQRPAIRRASKSIANFKLREGMAIGCTATLRGRRMYEFLDRLLNLALPRVRDFRGVSPKALDGRGNCLGRPVARGCERAAPGRVVPRLAPDHQAADSREARLEAPAAVRAARAAVAR